MRAKSPRISSTVRHLNPRLDKMIASYAATASAVGVALLAAAQPADAKVVYTQTRVSIGGGVDGRYNLDLNHDGILSDQEKLQAGVWRYVYYFILTTHILLSGIIIPFVLFTLQRAYQEKFDKHRKLAKITWPMWFYVAVTGVVVYVMVSPYY